MKTGSNRVRVLSVAVGLAIALAIAAVIVYVLMPREGPTRFAAVTPAQSAPASEAVRDFSSMPDWSGIWMQTNDQDRGDVLPYKPEWQTAYREFLDTVVKPGKFTDPLTVGYPGGIMRMMSPNRGLQFVLRPEQVWIIHERPDVRYIYTDGRPFPPPDELWPTFEGYSVGHWEGDTLVIETRSIRGGIPINRTGAALSDSTTVHERIRKIDGRTLQSDITVEDPVAFTQPWKVTRRYTRRDEQYHRMENVPSLENQRNPLVDGQTTIVLGDNADTSSPYPPDLRRFAVPNFPRP
jgi:hypothetical protein